MEIGGDNLSIKSFVRNFIEYPKMIGAICPSSKALAKKMVKDINFEKAQCIVEYGPGTGVFTDELIGNKREDTLLILIELNKDLYYNLCKRYNDIKNVIIVNDSAENIEKYIQQLGFQYADYIVSGLPFAAFEDSVSNIILDNTFKVLNDEGRFITFQYTLLKKDFINEFFDDIQISYEVKNIPPAFIFSCSK